MKRFLIFILILLFSIETYSQSTKKESLTGDIDRKLDVLLKQKIIHKIEIDLLEKKVNQLNQVNIEKSLPYYPKIDFLRKKLDKYQAEMALQVQTYEREAGQQEYYTLMSILEEDEKLRSFSAKDLIEIADRAFDLMTEPTNDLVYNEKIYKIRGLAYFELNNFTYALINFKKISNYKTDTLVSKYVALSYFNIRNYDEAEKLIDRSLAFNQNDEELIYARYQINKFKKHESGMFADLLELLDSQPNNIRYLKLMGDLHFNQKMYPKAYNCFKIISELEPKNSLAWLLMGNCYLAMNDKKNAINHYNKATDLGNQYSEKIVNGIRSNIVFTNSNQIDVRNEEGFFGTTILILNIGCQLKLIDQNEKWAMVQIEFIPDIPTIIGYLPKDKISFSLIGYQKELENNQTKDFYFIPEKSQLNAAKKTETFFKGWKSGCEYYVSSDKTRVPIGKGCE